MCGGLLDSPELARLFVDAVNGRLGVERAAEAAICSECWFEDCRRCSGGSCAHVAQGHYEPERAREQYKDAFEAGRRAGRQEAAQQVLTAADELLGQAHKASGHGLHELASALGKSVLQWRALADVISPGVWAARIAEGEPDGQH